MREATVDVDLLRESIADEMQDRDWFLDRDLAEAIAEDILRRATVHNAEIIDLDTARGRRNA